ncbi:MAG: hypothetical protein FJ276_30345 [Planctomycetes bacterium]|nr:hypothetical protein [Planctomycetota bacterium]
MSTIRGHHHNRQNRCRSAIECFRAVLLTDPANAEAYTGLAKSYELLGREPQRQIVLERTAALGRIANRLGCAVYRDSDLLPFLEIAELSESIGLRFHARAVAELILRLQEDHVGARSLLEKLDAEGAAADPLLAVLPPDLDTIADPALVRGDRGKVGQRGERVGGVPPRFRDIAREAGIDFERFDDMRGLSRILEQNGGGIAAFDYDRDGRVDLFFTNGCRLPRKERTGEQSNRLFRNLGGSRFADVTVAAGLWWNGYCHGCAVGDYNNDGFDDLYVTAFGENRFWHNNGDGTFSDVTDRTTTAVPVWSSSAAFADLNGDGYLDLYVVNYMQTTDDPPELCRSENDPNRYICCPATIFPAEQDVFFLSDGHGGFHDVTVQAGVTGVDGKGLGLVICDVDRNGLLDVYVTNDGTPNHLYMNQGVEAGSEPTTPAGAVLAVPRFREEAMVRGAAVDGYGHPNASMGIACGDYDNDGWPDLLSTHFYGETNILYKNLGDGIFVDETRASGLGPPSRLLLGFGAVFFDCDNDGWLDLFVTNGHVDDRTWDKRNVEPYRMPPSLYRNDRNGQFTEVSPSAGPYFARQYVGRSVATVDFDNDGDQDLVVSHQAGPSALVVNETPTACGSLTLALVGTGGSNRSAIGARIEVVGLDHPLVRELMGGTSYQATCDQRIHVGLGQHTPVPLLRILWPSGNVQEWQNVPAGSYMVVEGRADLVPAVR